MGIEQVDIERADRGVVHEFEVGLMGAQLHEHATVRSSMGVPTVAMVVTGAAAAGRKDREERTRESDCEGEGLFRVHFSTDGRFGARRQSVRHLSVRFA
ncbi:hypothetical protein ASA1KI_34070 [Opitutales bacterium ASA1]|nr:hypothetical protein ASA1KI_34070 [Opitutales bacterium ASA1]